MLRRAPHSVCSFSRKSHRMKSDLRTRHGGKILADALAAQGVKLAFGVPGESYLPVLDGLHDLRERIKFVICRQEGGASYMAEAYGKLTGEPGVLLVTRGPGATNGAIGVHTALQDSTPMGIFIGQVPTEFAEREACAGLQRWIEANGLGVGTSFRCQDLFDNRSANYIGDVGIGINPKLAERVKEADVLLVIGARLGEMTTSAYTLVEAPVPKQTLIHVHAGAEELGRVYRPALAINSGYPQFIEALEHLSFKNVAWKERTAAARKEFAEWTEPRLMPGSVQYGQVIRWLSDHLPEDAIIAGGAGNFAGWLHRHFRYKGFRTQLGSTNGSMGYGYPAAVAAKIAEPQRTVFALCGDGDFLMTGQEIATAAQYGANFVAVVVNNGLYGTIRMHQERE